MAKIDKTALRLAESNMLRAEAATERHSAKSLREGRDFMSDDEVARNLQADVNEARAALLECQADWVLHNEED